MSNRRRALEKIALITGAGKPQGLGFAVARALVAQRIRVILVARDLTQAGERAAEIGPLCQGEAADITDEAQILRLAERVAAGPGRLDILINNAAVTSPWGETAAGADLHAVQTLMEANLYGPWRIAQAFLPLLRQSPAGRIVNVSSGAGSHVDPVFGLTSGNPMGTGYAVSKAALNALTVKLALEEASSTLRINAVCPGFTATFAGGEAMGARPPAESAKGIVWAALLPADGPTGGFFRDGQPLGW
jgi:NAD(P)-dependent dehydrogenase (short-subunit alcohol dehydrogenase family)